MDTHTFLTTLLAQKGVKYVFGGETPEEGFDCSGLITYAAKIAGITGLPRTSSALSAVGKTVTRAELKEGDLIFFDFASPPQKVTHVGVYLGDGKMINAQSQSPDEVCEASIDGGYWKERILGFKRIFDGGLSEKGPLIASTDTATPPEKKEPLNGVHM